MKLLYATKNKSKIYNMQRRLKELPIELITPYDLDIKIEVIEDGENPSENALKKAKAYYEKTKLPTIAADSGFYISGLKDEKQPGVHVRRVGEKVLSDEEMIEYYSEIAKKLRGSADAYYITGLAMVTEEGQYTVDIEEDHFTLVEKRDLNHNHRGNPLDVITKDPKTNKYYCELKDDDIKNMNLTFEKQCIDFIKEHLK